MKNLILLLCLTPCFCLHGQESSTLSKLEKTYKGFMTACDEGNGEKAIQYLDHNSMVFFELMLNDLWYADSTSLEKLPVAEKHTILILRQTVPQEKLISFIPRTLAIYVLGEITPGSYVRGGYKLGELREENSKAFARLLVRDFYVDPEFEFTKENGHWKLSLIPFLQDAETHLLARYKKANTSEKDFILFLMESYSDKPISPEIWNPIKS